MPERLTQSDGQEVLWPHLKSGENLPPLRDKAYKVLFLYEVRRRNNMPPPTIREVGRYIDTDSTGATSHVIKKLIKDGYLIKHPGEKEISGRNIMIEVNFLTVKRLTSNSANLHDVPGLTHPITNQTNLR